MQTAGFYFGSPDSQCKYNNEEREKKQVIDVAGKGNMRRVMWASIDNPSAIGASTYPHRSKLQPTNEKKLGSETYFALIEFEIIIQSFWLAMCVSRALLTSIQFQTIDFRLCNWVLPGNILLQMESCASHCGGKLPLVSRANLKMSLSQERDNLLIPAFSQIISLFA